VDQDQTQLDAVLDALPFDEIAGGGSAPDAEQLEAAIPSEEEAVAPAPGEDEPVSAEAEADPTGAAAETPPAPVTSGPDYDSDDNPYKAAAEEARQLRQMFEMAAQRAAEQQAQQQREAKQAEWAERFERIRDDMTPEQGQIEARRLVAEIEAEREREAQRVVMAKDTDAQTAAAIAAGLHLSVRDDPELTEAQKQRILQNAQFLRQLPSPDAMQAQLARDAALRQQVSAQTAERDKQIAALQKQVQELQSAQKAKQRIASGVDAVGAPSGAPAKGGKSQLDQTLDGLWQQMT
jgi:hypothetical protein